MASLPTRRRGAAEAAHPAPRPRRPPLLRGADGRGGLLLRLLAALPPRRAVGDRRLARSGSCPTRPARPTTRSSRGTSSCTTSRPAPTRSPTGGWCSATTTCGSRTSSPAPTPSPYYRNAIGDECVYVESGTGVVETVFGVRRLPRRRLRVIPRATTHRWVPAEPSQLYAIEANSHIAPPKRYLSRYGQLLEHAPYCERDLHGPTEPFLRRGRRTSRCWSSTAPAPASSAPG